MLALVEGNSWGWGSAPILALLGVSVAAMVAFVYAERHSPEPMVDFTFFRSKSFLGANLVAFIVSFAMLAMFFFLALYMQNIKGYSPLQAGVRFLPSTAVIILAGPIAGRLTDRIGPKPLMTLGLLIVSASLFWQGHLATDTSYGFLVGAFVLMGLGMGLVMSPMSTAAMNAVDHTKAGVASGMLSMSRMVGGTFGVAAMGALVSAPRQEPHRRRAAEPAGVRAREARRLARRGRRAGRAARSAPPSRTPTSTRSTTACGSRAVVSALGALLTWMLIADKPAPAEAAGRGDRARRRDRRARRRAVHS